MLDINYHYEETKLRNAVINEDYHYKNIGLWEADAWKGRYSPVCTLAIWIETKNQTFIRSHAKSVIFDGRTDGIFDFKSCSVTYADVVSEWDHKGLFYKCSEMGGVCWIAMVPHAVRNGQDKNPRILVVLHEADFTDPNWAMETVEQYRAYNEIAAREGILVLYAVPNRIDEDYTYINILQELSTIYHLRLDSVLLDISTVFLAGSKLSEVPGFQYKDQNGQEVTNIDEMVEYLDNIPVLDMTNRWQNKVSLLYYLAVAERSRHPAFDLKRHIHSACGRRMADAMLLEHTYDRAEDPGLLQYWADMGLRYESHDKNGEPWVTLAPLSAYKQPEKKIPVMLVMSEISYANPFLTVTALSSFLDYCDIAAQGELMLLYFAMETPDDNDLLYDILQDAAEIYPIDKSRVYITGHSHNGHFSMEFMRRHPEAIAAVATLGNWHGIPAPAYSHEVLKVTDDKAELMSTIDMPVINIWSYSESEFNQKVDSEGFKNSADSWQRRLKAFNCSMKTFEDIVTAHTSPDYATRMIGVPCDRTEIQYKYGCECYIGDVLNNAGKNRLRLVTLENLPHMNTPQMPELSWDYVRRFARDQETGEVIELF